MASSNRSDSTFTFEITPPQTKYLKTGPFDEGKFHYYIRISVWKNDTKHRLMELEIAPKTEQNALKLYLNLITEWLPVVYTFLNCCKVDDHVSRTRCQVQLNKLVQTKYSDTEVYFITPTIKDLSDKKIDWREVAKKKDRHFYFVNITKCVNITAFPGSKPEITTSFTVSSTVSSAVEGLIIKSSGASS